MTPRCGTALAKWVPMSPKLNRVARQSVPGVPMGVPALIATWLPQHHPAIA